MANYAKTEASAFALLIFLATALYISSFRWAALVQFTAITVALGVPEYYSPAAGIVVLLALTSSLIVFPPGDSDVYPALLLALCAGIITDHSIPSHDQ